MIPTGYDRTWWNKAFIRTRSLRRSATNLIIKWKPGDVNLAGRFEDPGRDLFAFSVVINNNVNGEGGIKILIRAVIQENVWSPHGDGRNSDVLVEEK